MNIKELFNIDTEDKEPIKLSITDFVSKTRMILAKIDKEYGTANQWRMVEEHEHEEQDCENCKGECTIMRNGIELHCAPDKSEGECFVLEFQHETFIEELENIMFHDDKYSFYDLLGCLLEIPKGQSEQLKAFLEWIDQSPEENAGRSREDLVKDYLNQ